MSALKRILAILAAALIVAGLTTAAMQFSSPATASAGAARRLASPDASGGTFGDKGGRDGGSAAGLGDLVKNLGVTGMIVSGVAGLSVALDRLPRRLHGRGPSAPPSPGR